MPARTLMVQGTMSSAGKSLVVTALCRLFARRGLRVAPFKAQNMSNNAAVCPGGGEIGRAQAVQAAAAGIAPSPWLNPVLLKPEADARCQVVVLGRVWRTLSARDYYRALPELWPVVASALDRLRAVCDVVVIEGAGSPAELNLRRRDLANMAVARHAGAPVLLVGDIDRGGIFAQLLGTLSLLPPADRRRVRGLLVNKFRGDPALFADGVRILERRGGVPVLGVLPYLSDLGLPEEDAADLRTQPPPLPEDAAVDVAVVRLPRIANFDDFAPLGREPGVRVRYVDSPAALARPHAVILPGSKSTAADLDWLRARGLADAVAARAAAGTPVVGICGGYQMLGLRIRDPGRVESDRDEVPGLGLLPVETVFTGAKAACLVEARVTGGPGWLAGLAGARVRGYEIHMGRTAPVRPWLRIERRDGRAAAEPEGSVDATGRIWGCYLHGLFEEDAFRRAWLASLGWAGGGAQPAPPGLDAAIDRLADAFAAHVDLQRLEAAAWPA